MQNKQVIIAFSFLSLVVSSYTNAAIDRSQVFASPSNNPLHASWQVEENAHQHESKNLANSLITQIKKLDKQYGEQLNKYVSTWQKTYQIVLQNLESLSTSNASYSTYLELAYNMCVLVPILVESQGEYQPYNSTWSLYQRKDGKIYHLDGKASTILSKRISDSHVREISTQLISTNVEYNEILSKTAPGALHILAQTYNVLKASQAHEPFYAVYADIATNQIHSIKTIVNNKGKLKPANIRWSYLVDELNRTFDLNGNAKNITDETPATKEADDILKNDLIYALQIKNTNPALRLSYFHTYKKLMKLLPDDPFYKVYIAIAKNQILAVPLIMQNVNLQPNDALWSTLKDVTSGEIYDLSLFKVQNIDVVNNKVEQVKDLMNQLLQVDIDYADRIEKMNPEWRKVYGKTYNLLQNWVLQATSHSAFQDPFIETYIKAASNQIQSIPALVKAHGDINPVRGDFEWSRFEDKRGKIYDVQYIINNASY